MFKSLKHKLIIFYMSMLTLSLSIIGFFSVYMIQNYYDNGINSILKNQVENISNFYNNYLSSQSGLEDTIPKLLEMYKNSPYKIDFLDSTGKVINRSSFFNYSETINTPDFVNAGKNKIIPYTYIDKSSGEEFLSYVTPLKYQDSVNGYVRIKTSLQMAKESVLNIILMILIFITIIFIVNILLCIAISNSIIKPIIILENTSIAISKGDFSKKAEVSTKDEIGRLANSMNTMTDELAKAEKLKNNFISTISHELRTPLTSIKGWALVLLNNYTEKSEEESEGLSIIANEAERLTEIVNELLDFSKFQSGNLIMNLNDVELNQLLQNIYNQMKVKTESHGIQFSFTKSSHDISVNIDKKRIRQVIINLIDNAIKSINVEGEIIIKLNLIENGGESQAEITLTDNGHGIHPEDLPNIKKAFYQGKVAGQRMGIGMGLAICDEIIKLHGGILEIDSIYGTGTTVRIILPIM